MGLQTNDGPQWEGYEPEQKQPVPREPTGIMVQHILQELARARNKFPSANYSTLALMEEVGELAQAQLKLMAGKGTKAAVYSEAVQVAVMAMRVALDTDKSLREIYMEP